MRRSSYQLGSVAKSVPLKELDSLVRVQPNTATAPSPGGVSLADTPISSQRPSRADTATGADGPRYADLVALLVDPTQPARLLEPTGRDNQARAVGEGDAAQLMLQADHTNGLVVVAPIRPDLVTLDLDGCASVVRSELLHAAEQVGASLVYLAASGSVDSEHAVFGCPSAQARARLVDLVEQVRLWAGVSARQLDHRQGVGGALRLPGSASLKDAAAQSVPIGLDGRRLSARSAARRALDALAAVGLPTDYRPVSVAHSPSAAPVSVPAGPTVRAWRRRDRFTPEQLAALELVPGPGADRSVLACRAAWALWCHGVRSWDEAREHYATRSVFGKYSARADRGRSHWTRQAQLWASYRGAVSADDRARCDAWLELAVTWTDHDAAAAVVAVIAHRYLDGRGLVGRPVAVRDLALWLGCSAREAHRRLRSLVDLGVLEVARSHYDGPASEASRYTLGTPGLAAELYRGDLPHDADTPMGGTPLDPAVVLSPVWSVLGHRARAVWSLLGEVGQTTQVLAAGAGVAAGDPSYGARLALDALVGAGLAVRSGRGRSLRWSRGSVGLDAAGVAVGAGAALAALAQVVAAERAVWHSGSEADRLAAGEALAALRAGLGVGARVSAGSQVASHRGRTPGVGHTRRNAAVVPRVAGGLGMVAGDEYPSDAVVELCGPVSGCG